MESKKISSTKKCPKCEGSAKIVAETIAEFHPASGGPVQEIKLLSYKCTKCDHHFSDEMTFTEAGQVKNMRVHKLRYVLSPKRFLNKLITPWKSNPGFDTDVILIYVGVFVWAIVMIGKAFGFAAIPPQVTEVGSLLFGVGIGRASIDEE